MNTQSANPFDSSAQEQDQINLSDLNFDRWARAVRQQMLEALQHTSQIEKENPIDSEDLPDAWDDDESE